MWNTLVLFTVCRKIPENGMISMSYVVQHLKQRAVGFQKIRLLHLRFCIIHQMICEPFEKKITNTWSQHGLTKKSCQTNLIVLKPSTCGRVTHLSKAFGLALLRQLEVTSTSNNPALQSQDFSLCHFYGIQNFALYLLLTYTLLLVYYQSQIQGLLILNPSKHPAHKSSNNT